MNSAIESEILQLVGGNKKANVDQSVKNSLLALARQVNENSNVSGGGGIFTGYKAAAGIISLHDVGGINTWKLLNNIDHTTVDLDGVSQNNGEVSVDYTSLGITKVVGAWLSGGGDYRERAMGHVLSMGLTQTDINFYNYMPYETEFYLTYNGSTWVISATTGVTGTYGISWNSGTKVVTVTHPSFGRPLLDKIKYGGTSYATRKAREFDSGYSYTSTKIRIEDLAGAAAAPASGDFIIFTRRGKWFNTAGATGYTNERTSPTNQFTGNLYSKRFSTFQDWKDSDAGQGFNNFEFLIIGE